MTTTTTEDARPSWYLLRNSGEPRPRASHRTDVITTVLSVWFVLGLFLDAWAHATIPELETFFTPWHAVFYSGFAATACWVLWTVRSHVKAGRRGIAAVPLGYGATVVALPVFAVSGAADMLWHELIGIEQDLPIFFSPSHLGIIAAMIVILTSPLRSAWSDPAPRSLAPAVVTLAFATSLVLLFLSYANALLFSPRAIVSVYSSVERGDADSLAGHVVVTTLVLLAPLLLLARRWRLPFGASTIHYTLAALISAIITEFHRLAIPLAILAAGVLVDVLASRMRPSGARRAAFWGFAAAAPLLTWSIFFGVAIVAEGRFPAVPELWTGTPIVAALLGWLLAVLMLPNAADPAHPTSS